MLLVGMVMWPGAHTHTHTHTYISSMLELLVSEVNFSELLQPDVLPVSQRAALEYYRVS